MFLIFLMLKVYLVCNGVIFVDCFMDVIKSIEIIVECISRFIIEYVYNLMFLLFVFYED